MTEQEAAVLVGEGKAIDMLQVLRDGNAAIKRGDIHGAVLSFSILEHTGGGADLKHHKEADAFSSSLAEKLNGTLVHNKVPLSIYEHAPALHTKKEREAYVTHVFEAYSGLAKFLDFHNIPHDKLEENIRDSFIESLRHYPQNWDIFIELGNQMFHREEYQGYQEQVTDAAAKGLFDRLKANSWDIQRKVTHAGKIAELWAVNMRVFRNDYRDDPKYTTYINEFERQSKTEARDFINTVVLDKNGAVDLGAIRALGMRWHGFFSYLSNEIFTPENSGFQKGIDVYLSKKFETSAVVITDALVKSYRDLKQTLSEADLPDTAVTALTDSSAKFRENLAQMAVKTLHIQDSGLRSLNADTAIPAFIQVLEYNFNFSHAEAITWTLQNDEFVKRAAKFIEHAVYLTISNYPMVQEDEVMRLPKVLKGIRDTLMGDMITRAKATEIVFGNPYSYASYMNRLKSSFVTYIQWHNGTYEPKDKAHELSELKNRLRIHLQLTDEQLTDLFENDKVFQAKYARL